MAHDLVADEQEEFVQGRTFSEGDVVDEVARRVLRAGGEDVGLHHVVDIAEVTRGFTVAVDMHGLALQEGGEPLRDDRRIRAAGVLTLPEDVEVAQADGRKAVAAGEDVGVKLVDVFGDGIRREGLADDVLPLGERLFVAVGGA